MYTEQEVLALPFWSQGNLIPHIVSSIFNWPTEGLEAEMGIREAIWTTHAMVQSGAISHSGTPSGIVEGEIHENCLPLVTMNTLESLCYLSFS